MSHGNVDYYVTAILADGNTAYGDLPDMDNLPDPGNGTVRIWQNRITDLLLRGQTLSTWDDPRSHFGVQQQILFWLVGILGLGAAARAYFLSKQ